MKKIKIVISILAVVLAAAVIKNVVSGVHAQEGGNQPPFIEPIPNQRSNEGSETNLQIVASDPQNRPLFYSAEGLPEGMSINPATGLISGKPDYFSSGVHQVTITVTILADLTVCPIGSPDPTCQYFGPAGLQQAVDEAPQESTILVRNGTYEAGNLLQIGGGGHPEKHKLTIMGENKQETILDGQRNGTVVSIGGASSEIVVSSLKITNSNTAGIALGGTSRTNMTNNIIIANRNPGVSLFNSAYAEIANNNIERSGTSGVLLSYASQAKISGNVITNSSYYGIEITDTAQAEISGNIIARNAVGGIAADDFTQTEITNNTIYSNPNHGLNCGKGGETARCTVVNNISMSNALIGIVGAVRNNFTRLEYNDSFNNTESDWNQEFNCYQCGGDWPPATNISVDPLFVDPQNDDFHLRPNSPACTAGENGGHIGAFACGQPLPSPTPTPISIIVCPDGSSDPTCQYFGAAGLQQAVDVASDNKVVQVKNGRYAGNNLLQIGAGGHPEKHNLTITGEDKDQTIMDGQQVGSVVKIAGASTGIKVSSLKITNSGRGEEAAGITLSDSSQAEITNIVLSDNLSSGIAVRNSSQAEITHNFLSNNLTSGISLRDSSQADITNNVLSNNSTNGIILRDSSQADITNNTLYKNLQNGVNCGGSGAARCTTVNNISITNTILGIAGAVRDNFTRLEYNDSFGNIRNNWNSGAGWKNWPPATNISIDPQFVNPEAGDFHLRIGSPACTAGENGGYMGAFPCN